MGDFDYEGPTLGASRAEIADYALRCGLSLDFNGDVLYTNELLDAIERSSRHGR